MKFALCVLVLAAAVVVNDASVKNLKFSYESCSTAAEAIVINSLELQPDPVVVPGPINFNISVSSSVAVTSPTLSTYDIFYRADANSEWSLFHCVHSYLICGQPDVCLVLDAIFPFRQPCPQSFLDNNVPCHCPFEATTYEVIDGTLDLTRSLEDLSLLPGDYMAEITLLQDDVEIFCYSFQATVVEVA